MIKRVAAFNDLSGFGKCSLTAAIPTLSALGIQCNPIPTMILTGQGGYAVRYTRDMTDLLPYYMEAWQANGATFAGIYSGYTTGPAQIETILQFIDRFRTSDTFILVDPVMGDHGHTYNIFSEELLSRMKTLSRKASMITPNLTEACLLADVPISLEYTLEQATSIATDLRSKAEGNQDVIITGVMVTEEGNDYLYNVAATAEGIHYAPLPMFPRSFSGTGDLFASIMCGLKLNGYPTSKAIDLATQFLYHSIQDTMEYNTDSNEGIAFEGHLGELVDLVKGGCHV
ncbi:MAG: pyridoxamine kinase [Agathobacter sp.]|nr:pyridoxamine kinase [Agathobacter sp.]